MPQLSNMSAALLITLIGMGLVFLALMLLWGLMDIMVRFANRFFPDHEDEDGSGEDGDGGEEITLVKADTDADTDGRAQAAAAAVAVGLALRSCIDTAAASAVAVALSLKSRGTALDALAAGPSNVSSSSWQSVHRANRLSQRLSLFNRKSKRN
jgi:sodium pump decarboxylase gamma subunit